MNTTLVLVKAWLLPEHYGRSIEEWQPLQTNQGIGVSWASKLGSVALSRYSWARRAETSCNSECHVLP